MPTGRNAPCPCGSGRKYKSCCLHADLEREAERLLDERGGQGPSSESLFDNPETGARLRASARRDRTWEAGAIPLPSTIETDPEGRLVVVMVATRDAVLAMNPLSNLSGETGAVAQAILEVLEDAMRLTGARPRFVGVAHPEVAAALAPRLKGSGIQAQALGGYDLLYEPARSLVEDLCGVDLWPPMSKPDTWASWELPEAEVAALFRAAADFYRAAPWTVLADTGGLAFELEDGATWAGAVMGQGGETFGLALYEDPADLLRLYEDHAIDEDGLGAEEALETLEGRVVTLLFEEARDLPRAMRREVARNGWEVASPSAYPTLVVMNTPGGGVRRADLQMLTRALTLVPRFAAETGGSEAEGSLFAEWTDPETGTLVYPLLAEVPVGPFMGLEPGFAEGPGALPGAFLAMEEGSDDVGPAFREAHCAAIEVVNAFGVALAREGMGEATILTHVKNAAEFVTFLVTVEGVPLGGMHERDLRSFLLDWHPRTFEGGITRARRMPVSLDRFFEFLVRHAGLHCPWAAEVLEDRELIEIRLESAPPGDLMDPEVRGWREPFFRDMDARLLRPHLPEVHEALSEMETARAVNLARDLTRNWLLWREELLVAGTGEEGENLPDLLLERQRGWAREKGIS